MEMEMEQLLNMGFSQELAAQALAATGGKSTLKATEWILTTHKSNNISTPIPNHDPNSSPINNPSPFQPKLDRFFQTKSPRTLDIRSNGGTKESTTSLAGVKQSNDDCEEKSPPKRLKLWPFQKQSFPPSPCPCPSPAPLQNNNTPHEPLSERMRPRSIDDVIGQDHLLGRNSVLRSSLDSERLPSLVLWGPPGTGKTSIARAIAHSAPTSYRFVSLSAVTSGVKDVREAVEEARKMKKKNKRTLLFIDEVHRFNKAQQDSFLPVIEDGSVVFIGATTENPSFHLITPLLSRCRVFTLNPLQPQNIVNLLKQAANDTKKGLARSVGVSVVVEEEAFDFLSLHCDGDARVALNALEISATTAAARRNHGHSSSSKEESNSGSGDRRTGSLIAAASIDGGVKCGIPANEGGGVGSAAAIVTIDDVKEALQCKHLAYDRAGDEHYNLISALHKSMRGSDADASIYWLARMLEGGEEPLYIARRLIRFASEDVGLADPTALNQSVACYQACHFLGMPECNVILAQCVTYLALAPKSVAVYEAIKAAQKVVKESGGQNEGVPLHLRNAPTKLMKDIGYAKGYIYPPSDPSSASLQSYMPPSLQGSKFMNWPTNNADR